MIGLILQWLGAILVALGIMIPYRLRRRWRHCGPFGSTVYTAIMRECRPGQHRELLIGLIVLVTGLVLAVIGRRIAKRAGLD